MKPSALCWTPQAPIRAREGLPLWTVTLGRVLGEDIIATRSNLPWDNSAMDGFAIRAEDIAQGTRDF